MNELDVYPVERTNLAECVALFVSVFNNASWNENWDIETVAERLEDCYRTPGFYGLIVRIENEVVGFAMGNTERWDKTKHFYLKEMCVASDHQRRGVGTELMNALERELKNQGVGRIYLHTARDSPAQGFYDKQGFYVSAKMIMMSKWLGKE